MEDFVAHLPFPRRRSHLKSDTVQSFLRILSFCSSDSINSSPVLPDIVKPGKLLNSSAASVDPFSNQSKKNEVIDCGRLEVDNSLGARDSNMDGGTKSIEDENRTSGNGDSTEEDVDREKVGSNRLLIKEDNIREGNFTLADIRTGISCCRESRQFVRMEGSDEFALRNDTEFKTGEEQATVAGQFVHGCVAGKGLNLDGVLENGHVHEELCSEKVRHEMQAAVNNEFKYANLIQEMPQRGKDLETAVSSDPITSSVSTIGLCLGKVHHEAQAQAAVNDEFKYVNSKQEMPQGVKGLETAVSSDRITSSVGSTGLCSEKVRHEAQAAVYKEFKYVNSVEEMPQGGKGLETAVSSDPITSSVSTTGLCSERVRYEAQAPVNNEFKYLNLVQEMPQGGKGLETAVSSDPIASSVSTIGLCSEEVSHEAQAATNNEFKYANSIQEMPRGWKGLETAVSFGPITGSVSTIGLCSENVCHEAQAAVNNEFKYANSIREMPQGGKMAVSSDPITSSVSTIGLCSEEVCHEAQAAVNNKFKYANSIQEMPQGGKGLETAVSSDPITSSVSAIGLCSEKVRHEVQAAVNNDFKYENSIEEMPQEGKGLETAVSSDPIASSVSTIGLCSEKVCEVPAAVNNESKCANSIQEMRQGWKGLETTVSSDPITSSVSTIGLCSEKVRHEVQAAVNNEFKYENSIQEMPQGGKGLETAVSSDPIASSVSTIGLFSEKVCEVQAAVNNESKHANSIQEMPQGGKGSETAISSDSITRSVSTIGYRDMEEGEIPDDFGFLDQPHDSAIEEKVQFSDGFIEQCGFPQTTIGQSEVERKNMASGSNLVSHFNFRGNCNDVQVDVRKVIEKGDKANPAENRKSNEPTQLSSVNHIQTLEVMVAHNETDVLCSKEGHPISLGLVSEVIENLGTESAKKHTKAGKKKRRGPLTDERKAKKKASKKRKRAQLNREQGVKRLKLKPFTKPKVVHDCKFYLKGRCQQGDKCKFSHSGVPLTKSQPCSYFALGTCLKGEDCPFDHQLSKYPCIKYNLKGMCRRGETCLFSHEIPLTEGFSLASKFRSTDSTLLPDKTQALGAMKTYGLNCKSNHPYKDPTQARPVISESYLQNSQMDPGTETQPKLPAKAPEGIRFLSIGKTPLDDSSKQLQNRKSPSDKNKNEATNRPKQTTEKKPCNMPCSTEESAFPTKAPEGIRFLPLGKAPSDDTSKRLQNKDSPSDVKNCRETITKPMQTPSEKPCISNEIAWRPQESAITSSPPAKLKSGSEVPSLCFRSSSGSGTNNVSGSTGSCSGRLVPVPTQSSQSESSDASRILEEFLFSGFNLL